MGRFRPVQHLQRRRTPTPVGTRRSPPDADRILQHLARLELGLGRFLDLHRLAGAGVAAGRGLALRAGEGAEADQANLVALLQGAGDRVEHAFDGPRRIAPAETGRLGDIADQLLLVHLSRTPVEGGIAAHAEDHLKSGVRSESKGKREIPEKIALSGNAFVAAPQQSQWRTDTPGASSGAAASSGAGTAASSSASVHSIGTTGVTSAWTRTSSTWLTGTISSPSRIDAGISTRSFSFSAGISTFLMPPRNAASNFSLSPPIGRTRPRRVTSPVIATSRRTAIPVIVEMIAVTMPTPAEGPSFGTAPSGRWTWMSLQANRLGLTP